MKCEYDSGSMYGNRPLCDRPARYDLTCRNGSFSSLTIAVCERHLSATEARVYPSRTVVETNWEWLAARALSAGVDPVIYASEYRSASAAYGEIG